MPSTPTTYDLAALSQRTKTLLHAASSVHDDDARVLTGLRGRELSTQVDQGRLRRTEWNRLETASVLSYARRCSRRPLTLFDLVRQRAAEAGQNLAEHTWDVPEPSKGRSWTLVRRERMPPTGGADPAWAAWYRGGDERLAHRFFRQRAEEWTTATACGRMLHTLWITPDRLGQFGQFLLAEMDLRTASGHQVAVRPSSTLGYLEHGGPLPDLTAHDSGVTDVHVYTQLGALKQVVRVHDAPLAHAVVDLLGLLSSHKSATGPASFRDRTRRLL